MNSVNYGLSRPTALYRLECGASSGKDAALVRSSSRSRARHWLLPFQKVAEILQLIGGVALGGLVGVANQPTVPAVAARAVRRMQLVHSNRHLSCVQAGTPVFLAGPMFFWYTGERSVWSLMEADPLKLGDARGADLRSSESWNCNQPYASHAPRQAFYCQRRLLAQGRPLVRQGCGHLSLASEKTALQHER